MSFDLIYFFLCCVRTWPISISWFMYWAFLNWPFGAFHNSLFVVEEIWLWNDKLNWDWVDFMLFMWFSRFFAIFLVKFLHEIEFQRRIRPAKTRQRILRVLFRLFPSHALTIIARYSIKPPPHFPFPPSHFPNNKLKIFLLINSRFWLITLMDV